MKLNRTLLKLLRQSGPANDLNFRTGNFPAECTFSRASSATVFAPNRKGPNMAYNGDFSLGTVGWTNFNSLSSSVSSASGGIRVASHPSAYARVYQVFPTKIGTTYHLRGKIVTGANAYIIKSDSTDFENSRADLVGSGWAGATAIDEGGGVFSMNFVATSDETYIHLLTSPTYDAIFDDISMQEIIIGEVNSPISQVLVGPNKPRISWDHRTGRCKGFLSEPAAANYTTYSSSHRAYTKIVVTLADQPDGSVLATAQDNTGGYFYSVTTGLPGTGQVTLSMEVMAVSEAKRDFTFGPYAQNAGWGENHNSTARVEHGPGYTEQMGGARHRVSGLSTTEWTRVSITRLADNGGYYVPHFYFDGDDAGLSIKFKNVQLELGNRATSHIPTYGGAVARAADIATWPMAEDISNDSYVVEWENGQDLAPNDYRIIFTMYGGNEIECTYSPDSNTPRIGVYVSADASKRAGMYFAAATGRRQKAAFTMMGKGCQNALLPDSTYSPAQYLTSTRVFSIGSSSGSYVLGGHVERVRRFKRLLSDSELQYHSSLTEDTIDELGLAYEFDFTLGSLPPGLSFYRGSAATVLAPKEGNIFNELTLVTAPINAPRFQYDENSGECLGLLVEPQRTNLIRQSDAFLAFQTNDATVGTAAGPFSSGAQDAGVVTYPASSTSWSLYYPATGLTPGAWYTYSVWVKLGTAKNLVLGFNNTSVWGSFGPGVAFTAADGLSTTKYKRISRTFQADSTGGADLHIGYHLAGGPQQSPGTVYMFGHQLEEGREPTSYIRTTTAAVTRAADVCHKTVPFFRNGTIAVDFIRNDIGGGHYVLALGNYGGAYRHLVYTQGGTGTGQKLYLYSSPQSTAFPDDLKGIGERIKAAIAYTPTVSTAAKNGATQEMGDSSSFGGTVDNLAIGCDNGHGSQKGSIIASVRYFNRTLSNQELKVLTTLE